LKSRAASVEEPRAPEQAGHQEGVLLDRNSLLKGLARLASLAARFRAASRKRVGCWAARLAAAVRRRYQGGTATARRVLGRLLGPRLGKLRQHPPRPLLIPTRYYRRVAPPRWPTISIVTPTFNSARFVERTLASVIAQGYDNLQYIVQDGRSTDGTVDIVERHRGSLAGMESVRDRGQTDALNRGFGRATGEILAYLNSDDVLLPGTLHYVGAYFATHADVDVAYGHRVLIDENDREIGRWVLPPHDGAALVWADYVPQETLFWRRQIWERLGARLDESFQFAMDWDFLLRFRRAGARFVRLPRFLAAFRVHDDQKTIAQIATTGRAEMARLRERELGRPVLPEMASRQVRPYVIRHILWHRLYRFGLLLH
jgi:glycosyltransferase involved in cell wall biosynthesis